MVGDGNGSQFMLLLWNALHLTLQGRCHPCAGCHFELMQAGFTATYRPRQCLLTSRNTMFSIFRAGLLEPHGSESCTWQNRDFIRTHVLTQRPVCFCLLRPQPCSPEPELRCTHSGALTVPKDDAAQRLSFSQPQNQKISRL
jgi:hypothetical protein